MRTAQNALDLGTGLDSLGDSILAHRDPSNRDTFPIALRRRQVFFVVAPDGLCYYFHQEPSEHVLDLDREIEDAFDAEETMATRPQGGPAGDVE